MYSRNQLQRDFSWNLPRNHFYGKLIMMSIPAIYISHNLELSLAVHAKVARSSGGSRKFWWGGIWSTKPQKFGCLHQNWEWFFGRNRKFKRFFRPNSGGLQKKKKGLHQNWDWFFAGLVAFRSVGGDASRNGAELFETEADFSAKIVTFRLVGGGCIPPSKSATGKEISDSFRWRHNYNQRVFL